MCSVGAEDAADDWEVLTAAEAAGMLRMERGGGSHAPSPDVRLVRDMWVRRGGEEGRRGCMRSNSCGACLRVAISFIGDSGAAMAGAASALVRSRQRGTS